MLAVFFSVFVISLAFTSQTALAQTYLKSDHYSIASLTNGHSDLSTARFFFVNSWVQQDDTVPTEEFMNLKGTLTLDGGNYSIIEKALVKKLVGISPKCLH